MSRNQVTVTVSGGNMEENRQFSTMVFACLQEKGFTNVSINSADVVQGVGHDGLSIFDLVRGMNPEAFDTPIVVLGETDEDIRAAEYAAMESMFFSNQPRGLAPFPAYEYNA